MTIVGVISDTHGKLAPGAYAALADCDAIIHAGDIGGPDIIRELSTLAPVFAVLGNNDYQEYGSDVQRFARPVIDGVRFLVAHYPNDVRIGPHGGPGISPGDPIPQVCIHGHTHMPRLEWGPDVRPASFVLNPGSASRPRGDNPRSIARIVISDGRVTRVSIESFTGTVLLSVGSAASETPAGA